MGIQNDINEITNVPDEIFIEQALFSLRANIRHGLFKAYEPFYHGESRNYTPDSDKALRDALGASYRLITNDNRGLWEYWGIYQFQQGKDVAEVDNNIKEYEERLEKANAELKEGKPF